ncbi:MAG TPA: DUF4214 domain-containing protein [Pirellulales bacterium]|nr:DUF4214 domain-containing protein [Pirellulales bacterium]
MIANAGVSPSPLVGTGETISATEGQSIGSPAAVVATFSHQNGSDINDDFAATIEWGDGSSSTGTISTIAGSAGEWAVSGLHTYAEDGNYSITVLVNSPTTFPMVAINSRAIVFGSHEYHADVVSLVYLNLLNRTPDAAGSAAWSAELDAGSADQQIWAAIASSDEYFTRAIRENS